MKIRAELKPILVSGPFERLAVDCMGPLTLTLNGNRFIVVFICHFTKYIESFATPDITAKTIAKFFVESIVCRHGAPSILQSDRGTDFTSQLMKEIAALFATKQMFTSAYHPMANGTVDWDSHLAYATFATNIHVNESTKFSPFYLVYGRQPKLPIDCVLHYNPPLHFIDLSSYENEVKRHFTEAITV